MSSMAEPAEPKGTLELTSNAQPRELSHSPRLDDCLRPSKCEVFSASEPILKGLLTTAAQSSSSALAKSLKAALRRGISEEEEHVDAVQSVRDSSSGADSHYLITYSLYTRYSGISLFP